jgi:hypothetical protein
MLTYSVKVIFFHNDDYNQELNNLSMSLEELKLPRLYKKKILNIPKNLKIIHCVKDYPFINDFDKYEIINNSFFS